MGCYSFYNEDFKEHALNVYKCVKNDARLPIITRKFSLIMNASNIEKMIKDLILISALFHDLGKAIKYYQEGDLRRFPGHDFVGALIMKEAITYISNKCSSTSTIYNNDYMKYIIEYILISGSLFHLYLHRGKEEGWKIYGMEEIREDGLEISKECIHSILDTLNSFKGQASKESKALIECIAEAFESGKVNEYLKQYWRTDLKNIDGYYKEINKVKEYGWFFESVTAMINECDDEAARKRGDST
ncbi:hypothetical protein JCM16161A_09710 [Vulcanisaeta sp. JCM 16161]|uniref:hypothetical protein n=1 Tax=Vulcanisaeta sp. JCM 16161 TaxID=1295372 RepID=UPI00406C7101